MLRSWTQVARRFSKLPEYRSSSERLSDASYIELVTLLLGGRLPIAIMALSVVSVAILSQLAGRDDRALAFAGGIFVLLMIRAGIVTVFKRSAKTVPLTMAATCKWEVRYVGVVLPYAILFGLFNFHLVNTGDEAVRLMVVAQTFGFCAGMVSRGFVRPQLCALMVLMGAFPTAIGFLILAARTGGSSGIVFAFVGVLFGTFAVSSLETVRHLYRAILAQLATKRELAAFARVDPLTGLANRLAMREKLASEEDRGGGGQPFALLLIDLDGFKAVNDRHGHPTGDRVLREVARRLTETVSDEGLAVRLGGDEFCVIQTGLAKGGDAEAMGSRLIEALSEPMMDKGTLLQIGSSIGIALEDGSVRDIDILIERADSALYQAKRYGGNTLRVWRDVPKLTLAA
jgi:diguanylate cyclase (GGDEF)-like protein